jgi:hypothetical protein
MTINPTTHRLRATVKNRKRKAIIDNLSVSRPQTSELTRATRRGGLHQHCQAAGTTLQKAIDRVTDSPNHVFLCEPNRYRWAIDPPQNKSICPEESSGWIDRSAKKLDQCWAGIGWQPHRDVQQCHLA